MKDHQKDRIGDLISRIKKCQNQIRSSGGFPELKKFIGRKKKGEPGISSSSLNTWIKKLRDLRELGLSHESGLTALQVEQVDEYEDKIYYLENKVKEFSKRPGSPNVTRQAFFVYHLYMGRDGKEPKLGRSILKIKNDNSVVFKNVPDGISVDYFGSDYTAREDRIVFNLESQSGDKTIHLKIYCSDINRDKVFLGAFLTYEYHHIIHGTVVLEPVPDGEEAQPLMLSNTQNPQIFNSVNPFVREYLSFRRYSYKRVPKDIRNYKPLENFLYREAQEKPIRRFIEKTRPTVFIASPNSSVDKEKFKNNQRLIEKLKSRLRSRFSEKIEISNKRTKYSELLKEVTPPPSFRILQRSRFFILIYNETDQGSLSLVQLGWAMAHCKEVMLFYQKGSISLNIRRLNNLGVYTYQFDNLELEDDFEDVAGKIERKIAASLRHLLT
jgi:hypothetical protein